MARGIKGQKAWEGSVLVCTVARAGALTATGAGAIAGTSAWALRGAGAMAGAGHRKLLNAERSRGPIAVGNSTSKAMQWAIRHGMAYGIASWNVSWDKACSCTVHHMQDAPGTLALLQWLYFVLHF